MDRLRFYTGAVMVAVSAMQLVTFPYPSLWWPLACLSVGAIGFMLVRPYMGEAE